MGLYQKKETLRKNQYSIVTGISEERKTKKSPQQKGDKNII